MTAEDDRRETPAALPLAPFGVNPIGRRGMAMHTQARERRDPCRCGRQGRSGLARALLLLAVLALEGCASMGPGAVPRDRIDYTAGLQPAAAQV